MYTLKKKMLMSINILTILKHGNLCRYNLQSFVLSSCSILMFSDNL